MLFSPLAKNHRHPVSDVDDYILHAACTWDSDPVPQFYALPDSMRIIFCNAVAANDLGCNQTDLNATTLPELFGTTELATALAAAEQSKSATTLRLKASFTDVWDCATLEFAGRGLTRFVKLNITRLSLIHI